MPADPTIDVDSMKFFSDFLYERRTGYACLAMARDGMWREFFFEWPAQEQALIDQARGAAPTADVYIGVLLYSAQKRASSNALPGRRIWVDCDDDPDDSRRTWIIERGGLLVESGGDHRFHGYLSLRAEVPAELLEELSHALAARIGGDSKWSAASVLRLPGTLHHKQSPPRPVTLIPPS